MSYLIPGTNYSWISSETRYRNGRLVFLGYDDAEFCANAWERQAYGGLGAGFPRRETQRDLAFEPPAMTRVPDSRRFEWTIAFRERGA